MSKGSDIRASKEAVKYTRFSLQKDLLPELNGIAQRIQNLARSDGLHVSSFTVTVVWSESNKQETASIGEVQVSVAEE